MKAFMTIGTLSFLQQLTKKHPSTNIYLMNHTEENSSLAYYEGIGKNIFTAGKTYDILLTTKELRESGFVIMHNIPITKENQPIFEERMEKALNTIEKIPGFYAGRLLKHIKKHHYVVLTQWASLHDFDRWKTSDTFIALSTKHMQPAYFASRAFTTSYIMYDENE